VIGAAVMVARIATGEIEDTITKKNPNAAALGKLGGAKGGKARADSLSPLQHTINRFATRAKPHRVFLAQQDLRCKQSRGISRAGPAAAGRRQAHGPVKHDQDRRSVRGCASKMLSM
jgi:hypothetical protein